MKVLCFEQNAREQLLAHLGFDAVSIAEEASKFIDERNGTLRQTICWKVTSSLLLQLATLCRT
jgi:hypothetical protein